MHSDASDLYVSFSVAFLSANTPVVPCESQEIPENWNLMITIVHLKEWIMDPLPFLCPLVVFTFSEQMPAFEARAYDI